jgi:YgiT-type zinc finger domain-containing protein
MKIKKWIDCPSCGAKKSMKHKKNITETYKISGYEPITITSLDGDFCSECSEGFYSIRSEKIINSRVAEEKAKQDSSKVVASELMEIDTIAKKLSVSRQRIHQMMNEGKIRYVYVGKLKFPLKSGLKTAELAIKRHR